MSREPNPSASENVIHDQNGVIIRVRAGDARVADP